MRRLFPECSVLQILQLLIPLPSACWKEIAAASGTGALLSSSSGGRDLRRACTQAFGPAASYRWALLFPSIEEVAWFPGNEQPESRGIKSCNIWRTEHSGNEPPLGEGVVL
ncbi:hypothetical protein GDO78_011310 [Eleutherodactylus coqui]|uniref:Secreted protein n=1 Tax=Eleutherodactylus coqui TaxID=57060 RepID=A0A8J6F9I9_ELECQ|nr:hypothetical protein GDO78_011310 [Eleutherodactylus coqui]